MVSDGRTYLGRLEEREQNHVVLGNAFELRTIEMRRPNATGRGVEVVLQNMHVQESLCAGAVDMELWITKIRYIQAMDDLDRHTHIKFIESALETFKVQRARASGIEIARA